jgi:hypothetical protein
MGLLPLEVKKPSELIDLFFGVPFFMAYYYVPLLGVFFLPLLTAFNIISLFGAKTKKEKILLGLYLLVFLVFDVYIIWWYWTGQKFDFL